MDYSQYMNSIGFKFTHTGGGCTAWEKQEGPYYVMITDGDLNAPASFSQPIEVGIYRQFDDGEISDCLIFKELKCTAFLDSVIRTLIKDYEEEQSCTLTM